jgi:hypothetical protein
VLDGSAELGSLAARAPELRSFAAEPLVLPGVELLQVTYEAGGAQPESLFPPGLSPTLPVLAVLSLWRAPVSPIGGFTLAQLRLSCRSGVRPRQLLLSSFAAGDTARGALNERFGFGARAADVRLERGYDRIEGGVSLGGRALLQVTALAPLPLASGDLQFFSSVHPARTEKGLRLVQIDTDFAVSRAERGRPRLERFDAEGFGAPALRLSYPVAAFFAVADVTLQKIRFVSRADVPAFAGTEKVG